MPRKCERVPARCAFTPLSLAESHSVVSDRCVSGINISAGYIKDPGLSISNWFMLTFTYLTQVGVTRSLRNPATHWCYSALSSIQPDITYAHCITHLRIPFIIGSTFGYTCELILDGELIYMCILWGGLKVSDCEL